MKTEDIKVGMFLRYTKGEESMVGTAVMGDNGELLFEWGPKACAVSELAERDWTPTLLVPAEEVEKALEEGRESGLFDVGVWERSRAKRVSEGLE